MEERDEAGDVLARMPHRGARRRVERVAHVQRHDCAATVAIGGCFPNTLSHGVDDSRSTVFRANTELMLAKAFSQLLLHDGLVQCKLLRELHQRLAHGDRARSTGRLRNA